MILKKQLLVSGNPGRVITPFSKQSGDSHQSSQEWTSKQVYPKVWPCSARVREAYLEGLLGQASKGTWQQIKNCIYPNLRTSRTVSFFTDETQVELLGPNAQHLVWLSPNIAYQDKQCIPKVRHGGGRVMICVCFAVTWTGRLAVTEMTVNSSIHWSVSESDGHLSGHQILAVKEHNTKNLLCIFAQLLNTFFLNR